MLCDMQEMRCGDQVVWYDENRTAQAYASLQIGGCEECGCGYCRNFAAQRGIAYPNDFRLMLASLGIDPNKEGEVYECATEAGLLLYGGWFFFAGKVLKAGERLTELPDGFQYYFADGKHLPKPSADFGADLAAVEFYTKIPWVLPEEP
jgi:hypothetical protein